MRESDTAYITNRAQNRQSFASLTPRRAALHPGARASRDLLPAPASYDTTPRHRQTAPPAIVWYAHGPTARREIDRWAGRLRNKDRQERRVACGERIRHHTG